MITGILLALFLAAEPSVVAETEEAQNCSLLVRPVTAAGIAAPEGLLVWVSPTGSAPRSQSLPVGGVGVQFEELPCGPTTYGVFLPYPDTWSPARSLKEAFLEELRRTTVVEPVVPQLFRVSAEVVSSTGEGIAARIGMGTVDRDRSSEFGGVIVTNGRTRSVVVVPAGQYVFLNPRTAVGTKYRFIRAEVNGVATQKPVIADVHEDMHVQIVMELEESAGTVIEGRLVDEKGAGGRRSDDRVPW